MSQSRTGAQNAPLGPWDGVKPSSIVSNGKRSIVWTAKGPDVWLRNQYVIAWLEVTEGHRWQGDPGSVFLTRRISDGDERRAWTQAAVAQLRESVRSYVDDVGFELLWWENREPRAASVDSMVVEAEKLLDWWQRTSVANRMVDDGSAQVRHLGRFESRALQTALRPSRAGWGGWETVGICAEVIGSDGVRAGWVTDDGHVIAIGGGR